MLPRSTYTEFAPPAPDLPVLTGARKTAVAVIGAGFTGLSTALHLREAGVDVAVLEAREPGWGASGRNGGQVNPGLKYNPDEIEAHFRKERGARLVKLVGGAPSFAFDLIERLGIACDARRSGSIRVAISKSGAQEVAAGCEQWAHRGAPVERLDADGLARLIGTTAYAHGYIDHRGGSVNPLSYARGLARAALGAGAAIYGASPALSLRREGSDWVVATARGSLAARHVVLATNGYTDRLWPGLARSILPVYSAVAATEKLPPEVARRILPARQVVYESSSRVTYFRVDSRDRLLMGGTSRQRDTSAPTHYRHLMRLAHRLFPDLRGIRWTAFWNGQLAITPDLYPRLHEPVPGVLAGLGYSGRGVAMATVMGSLIARRILGAAPDDLDLPMTGIQPIPLHRFWRPAIKLRLFYRSLAERLDR